MVRSLPFRDSLLVGMVSMMAASLAPAVAAALPEANYDEQKVRSFTLPDVLAGPDGKPVTTPEAWRTTARPHQLQLLETHVYGRRLPAVPVRPVGDVERTRVALAGDTPAIRVQARLRMGEVADAPQVDVLLYLPEASRPGERVPVFLNLNFRGNQSETPDPAVRITSSWV